MNDLQMRLMLAAFNDELEKVGAAHGISEMEKVAIFKRIMAAFGGGARKAPKPKGPLVSFNDTSSDLGRAGARARSGRDSWESAMRSKGQGLRIKQKARPGDLTRNVSVSEALQAGLSPRKAHSAASHLSSKVQG